jgi:hypothetical protein
MKSRVIRKENDEGRSGKVRMKRREMGGRVMKGREEMVKEKGNEKQIRKPILIASLYHREGKDSKKGK